jgi:hypothetical protein
MRSPDFSVKLSRYCRKKSLRNGRCAYFFEPPTWARNQGCCVQAEALGTEYAVAMERAENILLPAFDSWRSRGLTDMAPPLPVPGSFDWLVFIFKSHQKWNDVSAKTQRCYDQGFSLVANHILKDGTRVGSKQISDFTKGFVDAIYAKLLFVEETDANGTPIQRERRRFANAAMTACRRAWFVGQRAQETMVPAINPFARMGLKARSPSQIPQETPTANWDELVAFRRAANKLGYGSVGTAALLAWEWLQREEHVFGAFDISHYRPSERPNAVRIVHPKNGEEAWWPLFDEVGAPLFPELMADLDEIKEKTTSGLVFRRDHEHRRSLIPLPWITARGDLRYLRTVVKKIVLAAGIRRELSFSSFRHGGFTEGADSDLTDAELRAAGRHRSARQLPTYAKRTRKQLIAGSKKRREERTKIIIVPK